MFAAIAYNAFYMIEDAEEKPESNDIKKEVGQMSFTSFFNELVQNKMPILTKNNVSEFYFLLLLVAFYSGTNF